MISNQEIYDYIDNNGIKLVIDKEGLLPQSIKGLYVFIKGELPPTIVLSGEVDLSTAYGRCILAEEIGHYETTVYKTILNKEQQTFFHREQYHCVSYIQAEREARKWGARFLMPEKEFIKKLKEFALTGESLSDYFGVTDEFIKMRLNMLHIW